MEQFTAFTPITQTLSGTDVRMSGFCLYTKSLSNLN